MGPSNEVDILSGATGNFIRTIFVRMSTMKPKYVGMNSKLMIPDFPHNVRIRFFLLRPDVAKVSALLAISV